MNSVRSSCGGLRSFGVDTSAVLLEPGRLSPVTFTLIEDQGGRRYVRFTRGDTSPLVPADLPATLFDRVRLVYIDAEMPEVQIVAAERARARGARVILGIRRMGPGLGELLDLADIVIASERVAAEIAHSADIERSLIELTKMGPDIAVITLGEDGAVGLHEDKLVRQQALTVDVVDVTGAGSVFRGAFGYALLQDWPLERALPFANAAAGLNCASLGGQAGIPTLEAVERAAPLRLTRSPQAVSARDRESRRGCPSRMSGFATRSQVAAAMDAIQHWQPGQRPGEASQPPHSLLLPPSAPVSPALPFPSPASRPSSRSNGDRCVVGSCPIPSLPWSVTGPLPSLAGNLYASNSTIQLFR